MFSCRRFAKLLALPLLTAGLTMNPAAYADDLRISLPLLPPTIESANKGPLAKLAQAIARQWKEGKATVGVPVPFSVSVDKITSGEADVHFPLIAISVEHESELPYRYSTVTLYEVPFALYSRQGNAAIEGKTLTIAMLSKLKIETERGHAPLFFFQPHEADSIKTALMRVASGEIDGFLFSANATDPVLKQLKLKNIVRSPYRTYKAKMILPKGPAGHELDEKLDLIIAQLKDTGEYQKIMAPLLTTTRKK